MRNKEQFKQSCYYCGAPKTSLEHAPPKQLFKGFDCNKIKAPSCDIHNGQKSGRDTAVIKGMLIALDTVAYKYPPKSDAAKAINLAKLQFSQVKRQIKNINKIEGFPSLTHFDSSIKTEDWMKQLTAALVYDAVRKYDSRINFDEAIVFCPTWVRGEPTIELERIIETLKVQKLQDDSLQKINWEKGWPSGKKNYPTGIYNFKLSFDFLEDIVFRHQFFDSLVWYVGVRTTNETREKIIKKLRINKG